MRFSGHAAAICYTFSTWGGGSNVPPQKRSVSVIILSRAWDKEGRGVVNLIKWLRGTLCLMDSCVAHACSSLCGWCSIVSALCPPVKMVEGKNTDPVDDDLLLLLQSKRHESRRQFDLVQMFYWTIRWSCSRIGEISGLKCRPLISKSSNLKHFQPVAVWPGQSAPFEEEAGARREFKLWLKQEVTAAARKRKGSDC